jgi:hypothetical protein
MNSSEEVELINFDSNVKKSDRGTQNTRTPTSGTAPSYQVQFETLSDNDFLLETEDEIKHGKNKNIN